MAVPSSFAESNAVFEKPPDMTHEECGPLSVWQGRMQGGGPVVVSCWKLTREELEEINRTGRIWLYVHSHGMPPSVISGKNPFEQPETTPL